MSKRFSWIVVGPLALFFATIAPGQSTDPDLSGGISGFVRFPDGTPSGGATVSATTECKGMPFNLVQEATTSPNGSFHIPAFQGTDCDSVRLAAGKAEDFWLKTGSNIFYHGDNGTTPLAKAPRLGPPARVDITLGIQGGLVSIRVLDNATGRFIYAGLSVEKVPPADSTFGSMDVATARDGSADTLLVPAGRYRISVLRYSCGEAVYFARHAPSEVIEVKAGQRMSTDFSVDVRLIDPASSYSNPHGRRCKP